MASPGRSWEPVAAAVCAGVATWCSRGALAVTSDGARVGILPPIWQLVASVVAALAIVLALKPSSAAARPLWLSGVLVAPWMPAPLGLMPASVLAFSGPMAIVVWIAVGALLAASSGYAARGLARITQLSARRATRAAGAAALVVCGAAAWWTAERHPLGDEPHYLIITQSLLLDRDLQIENNHERLDYASYMQMELPPHYLQRGVNGQIYSVHAPGLPAIVAPVFAVAGYRGVVVLLVLAAALGAALLWRTAYLVTGDAAAAWFGWAVVTLSAPMLCAAGAVFPDVPGSVIVIAAVLAVVSNTAPPTSARPSSSVGRWMAAGALASLLPWLHTRFAILAASLGVVAMLRLLSGRRDRWMMECAAFLVAPVLSAAAWFGFFAMVYGTPSPGAPYGNFSGTELANVVAGAPGLLFDQRFGLIAAAPAYALALAGLVLMTIAQGASRRLGFELLAIVGPYFLTVTAYQMWWGGLSSPARFAVAATPILGIGAAWLWSRVDRPATRQAILLTLGASITIAGLAILPEHGRFSFLERRGLESWLDWLSPVVDLPHAYPSFFAQARSVSLAQAAIWIAALVSAWFVARWIERRVGRTSPQLTTALMCVAALIAMTGSWQAAHARAITPARAQLHLLAAVDTAQPNVGLLIDRGRVVAPQRVISSMVLEAAEADVRGQGPLLFVAHLPAGAYRVLFSVAGAGGGRVEARLGRATGSIFSSPIDQLPVLATPPARFAARDGAVHSVDFTLPVDASSMTIVADASARTVLRGVGVAPLDVFPRGSRDVPIALCAAQYPHATAYFSSQCEDVEPNGFWVRGDRAVEVAVTPADGAGTIRVRLRAGVAPTDVRVVAGSFSEDLHLAPGQDRTIDVPIDPARRGALMRFTASGGARPSDQDRRVRDNRLLACWVEVEGR